MDRFTDMAAARLNSETGDCILLGSLKEENEKFSSFHLSCIFDEMTNNRMVVNSLSLIYLLDMSRLPGRATTTVGGRRATTTARLESAFGLVRSISEIP